MTDCPLPRGSVVWGYARDSGGETQERSVESQEKAILDYSQEHGLVLQKVFADEARPGSGSERPQFDAMISLTRQEPRRADAILVWSFSRFSRNSQDSQFFKADLRRRGWQIVSLSDDLPDGEFAPVFEALIEWKDQRFLKDLSEASKRGLRDLALQGYAPGGFPPKGYLAERREVGTKRDGKPRYASRWVPDPEWAPMVTKAFDMKADGHSHAEIIKATGITQSINTLPTMLRNKTYIGTRKCGDTEVPGAHEPLVSQEVWDRVQNRMKVKPRKGKAWPTRVHPKHRSSRYLLSGLIKCALCGSAMIGSFDRLRSGNRFRFYICNLRKRQGIGACHAGKVSASLIEGAIMSALLDRILTPEFVRQLADESAARLDRDMAQVDEAIKATGAQLAKLDGKMANLLDAVERDGSEVARHRLQEREIEAYQLREKLRALERRRSEATTYLTDEMLNDALTQLRYNLSVGSVRKRRAVLRSFVDHIDADKEKARLWYTFPVLPIEGCPQQGSIYRTSLCALRSSWRHDREEARQSYRLPSRARVRRLPDLAPGHRPTPEWSNLRPLRQPCRR